MIPSQNQFSLIPNRDVLLVIAFGVILMLGIILASENLNYLLQTKQPVMASTSSAPQSSTPAPAPISAAQSNPLDDMASILNNPENFRVVPADIKPAQAIIEGKTIKFLMGI